MEEHPVSQSNGLSSSDQNVAHITQSLGIPAEECSTGFQESTIHHESSTPICHLACKADANASLVVLKDPMARIDASQVENACATLARYAHFGDSNRTYLIRAGCLPLLKQTMQAHVTQGRVQNQACKCLARLASGEPDRIESTGFLELILFALRDHPQAAGNALKALCQLRPLEVECLPMVVAAMKAHPNHPSIQESACTILSVLARDRGNLPALMASGCASLIVQAMRAHGCFQGNRALVLLVANSPALLAVGPDEVLCAASVRHPKDHGLLRYCLRKDGVRFHPRWVVKALGSLGIEDGDEIPNCTKQIADLMRQHADDSEVQDNGCSALFCFAQTHVGTIVEAGCLELIVLALRHPGATRTALTALNWLSRSGESIRQALVEAGCLPLLVAAMKAHAQGQQQLACEVLSQLARDPCNVPALMDSGCLPLITQTQTMTAQQQSTASDILVALASDAANIPELLDANPVALFQLACERYPKDHGLLLYCLRDPTVRFAPHWVVKGLNVLGAAADDARPDCVRRTVDYMRHHAGDSEVQMDGCDAIEQIIAPNLQSNVQLECLQPLLSALRDHPQAARGPLAALGQLAKQSALCPALIQVGCLPAVVATMRAQPEDRDVQGSACCILSGLAQNPRNLPDLMKLECAPLIVRAMQTHGRCIHGSALVALARDAASWRDLLKLGPDEVLRAASECYPKDHGLLRHCLRSKSSDPGRFGYFPSEQFVRELTLTAANEADMRVLSDLSTHQRFHSFLRQIAVPVVVCLVSEQQGHPAWESHARRMLCNLTRDEAHRDELIGLMFREMQELGATGSQAKRQKEAKIREALRSERAALEADLRREERLRLSAELSAHQIIEAHQVAYSNQQRQAEQELKRMQEQLLEEESRRAASDLSFQQAKEQIEQMRQDRQRVDQAHRIALQDQERLAQQALRRQQDLDEQLDKLRTQHEQALHKHQQQQTERNQALHAILNTLQSQLEATQQEAAQGLDEYRSHLCTSLSDLKLISYIASGSFGAVFLCTSYAHPDVRYCVKYLLNYYKDDVTTTEVRKKHTREVQMMARLPMHPVLVHPFATFYVKELPPRWLEHIPADRPFDRKTAATKPSLAILYRYAGRTLNTSQASEFEFPQEIVSLLDQLLEALELFAAHRLVHRDIKGDNILIDPATRRLRVIDLGEAAFCDAGMQLHTDQKWANPGTLPPEIAECPDPPYNYARADVFAAALTFWGFLLGNYVANKDNGEFHPSRLPALPAPYSDLQPLLVAMLHPDPAQRLDASAARHALLERFPVCVLRNSM